MHRGLWLVTALVILTSDSAGKAWQKEPPKEFINSVGMKFVWIAPGTFMMGLAQGQ